MKILFVSYHCCIRVIKECQALKEAGHTVHYLQNTVANHDFLYVIDPCSFYSSPQQLYLHVQKTDANIIHVHNQPDWIVAVCREARPDLPLVFDVHDVYSIEHNCEPKLDEIVAFESADAYVFPSVPYLERAREIHPIMTNRLAIVLHSACTEGMVGVGIPTVPWPRLPGIVYEGGVSALTDGAGVDYPDYRPWVDYSSVVLELAQMGIPFSIYSDAKHRYDYLRLGAIFHEPLHFLRMLMQISRYDWGFVGNSFDHPQQNMAAPNKIFEYMAAGLPVMVYRSKEAGRLVEEMGIGLVINNLREIPQVYEKHHEIRERVNIVRRTYTMNSQIGRLVDLYRQVAIDFKAKQSTNLVMLQFPGEIRLGEALNG